MGFREAMRCREYRGGSDVDRKDVRAGESKNWQICSTISSDLGLYFFLFPLESGFLLIFRCHLSLCDGSIIDEEMN